MKIAFIDMSFHLENTRSSDFFVEILKPLGEVFHISNSDYWRVIPKIKPDVLILWQFKLTDKEIDFYGIKNVVLIPMFDDCSHDIKDWQKYKKYKVFCFSKMLYTMLKENNFDCFYSQYYIKPSEKILKITDKNSVEVFFWQRYQKLMWNTVKQVCQNLPINKIHFHTGLTQSVDSMPTDQEIKKYNITFSTWFKEKSDLNKILDNTTTYICPRICEGIGLSFIEAIAKGNLVIGFDAPTMNEYITDGVDGLLFSYTSFPTKKLEIVELQKLQNASIKKAKEGYQNWISSIPQIQNFVAKPLSNYNPKKSLYVYCKIIYNYLKLFVKKIIGKA